MSKKSTAKLPKSLRAGETTTIEDLQNKLFSSINAAFELPGDSQSRDTVSDYGKTGFSDISKKEDDPFFEYKNPYQSLADKAKAYVKEKEAESRKPVSNAGAANKKKAKGSDAFLTGIGLEGNVRRTPSPERLIPGYNYQVSEVEPELDYKDVLKNAEDMNQFDDLEELRRMIKKTSKEMKSYGRELIGLKNSVSEVNDYAGKELGYKASGDLMYKMDYAVNDLGEKGNKKFVKKAVPFNLPTTGQAVGRASSKPLDTKSSNVTRGVSRGKR